MSQSLPKMFVLNNDRKVVEVEVSITTIMEYAKAGDEGRFRVGSTEVGPLTVSTVFIPVMIGPPHGTGKFFETAILSSHDVDIIERYMTWEDAQTGHDRAVAVLRQRLDGSLMLRTDN